MNVFFLVEGTTEKMIYPSWLKYLLPELMRVKYSDRVEKNNYYLERGKGYPQILDGFDNAVDKIAETKKYDYLVLCVDADEESVNERVDDINDFISNFMQDEKVDLGQTQIEIVVQNHCIETWLLGNRKIFNSRQPLTRPLSDYVGYYDVSQDDPELMGKYSERNHADFHCKYLKEIFIAKGRSYTKGFPKDAQEKYYLEQLQKRVRDKPTHLKTLQGFLDFCERIRKSMAIDRGSQE